MRGVGFHNTARWFETAYGYGTGGGMDRAIFYDSSGNDTFVGTSTRGRLTGPGYYLQAVRCDVVRAFSQSGGQDKARLFDSAGDDVLVATLEYTYLRGSPSSGNFKNRADGFAEVESTARFGGDDTARLYDSALDDYLHAEGNSAVITWNAARVLSAYDFDQVEADGSPGGVNELKKVLPIDYVLMVTGDWTEI